MCFQQLAGKKLRLKVGFLAFEQLPCRRNSGVGLGVELPVDQLVHNVVLLELREDLLRDFVEHTRC